MIFDTHTHLNVEEFAGREAEEIALAAEMGVTQMNIVGFDKPTMHTIRNVYKMIYRSGKTLEEVMPEIEQIAATESAISFFLDFFKRSTRGIIR